MRIVLRLLIALNWSVAGFASMFVAYGHHHCWLGQCSSWAHERLAREAPELEMGTEEHRRRSAVLADEYGAKTRGVADLGWEGGVQRCSWGAGTAVVLMLVFPKTTPPPPN